MTEEKFKQIKELQDKIDSKRKSIRTLEVMLGSCNLYATISATPRSIRTPLEYRFSNKEELTKIINLEKSMLEFDLDVLLKEFEKL